MRRYITLLLALLLALSLAGCGGYTEEDIAAAKRSAYDEGYDAGYEAAQNVYSTPANSDHGSAYLIGDAVPAGSDAADKLYKEATVKSKDKQIDKQATANAWRDPNWDGQPVYYEPESSDYDSIFTYGTDADSILDYIRDNPHEFNLYTEGDMCDAHEAGANGEDWIVR